MTDGYSDVHKNDVSTEVKIVKKKKPMKCPHCRRGELVNPHPSISLNNALLYTCSVCSRGWHQDEKGNWHSHFATDVEVYSSNGKKLLDNSTWHINERNQE